jgi:hypothetical protein
MRRPETVQSQNPASVFSEMIRCGTSHGAQANNNHIISVATHLTAFLDVLHILPSIPSLSSVVNSYFSKGSQLLEKI